MNGKKESGDVALGTMLKDFGLLYQHGSRVGLTVDKVVRSAVKWYHINSGRRCMHSKAIYTASVKHLGFLWL